MRGKIDGAKLLREIDTVEKFMEGIAAMQQRDDGRGNVGIGFIARPRRFSILVSASDGEFVGKGSTMVEAMRALTASLKRT